MEMLEEQQREEMELAALQEEQENEQVRQRQNICCNWISESITKLFLSWFKTFQKAFLLRSIGIKALKAERNLNNLMQPSL